MSRHSHPRDPSRALYVRNNRRASLLGLLVPGALVGAGLVCTRLAWGLAGRGHASSAWWGFTTENKRQRIEAFIRRSTYAHFVLANLPSFAELCKTADEALFNNIVRNPHHVLHYLLPPQSHATQHYNLRPRKHTFQLPPRTTHLIDCNFINRLLYSLLAN